MPPLTAAKLIGGLLASAILIWGGWSAWSSFAAWVREPVQEKLDAANTKIADLQAEKAKCNGALDAQTKGVADLKEQANKWQEASARAVAEAKKQADKHRQTALDILAQKPEVPGDLCESARRVLVK